MGTWRICAVLFVSFIFLEMCSQVHTVNISITVFAPKLPMHRLFALDKVKIGVEIAKEKVIKDKLRGHNLNVDYVNSNASDVDSPVAAFNFMSKGVHLFIGPVYDFGVAPVARYAPKWNIPVISPGGFAHSLNQKRSFQTLTRVHTTFNSMAAFVFKILQHYNWSKLKAVSERFGRNDIYFDYCDLAITSIYQVVLYKKIDFERYEILRETKSVMAKHVLDKINTKYAVVVLCASADSVREILIKAHELNFDNGEYVFLNIDLFSSKNESEKPWYRADDTKERNDKAMKAYEALMTVTLRKPTSDEYKNFSKEVKRRAQEKNVNFTYGEEEVNSFVGAFHDAVILYALALNETLAANKSITDGAEITNRMWNRTFDGITGTVSIDDNGDRNADYSLLDMNPHTHKFEVVANYFGKDKEYKEVPNKHIHWAGGRTSAPPDTPKCGFDRSKCPPDKPFPEYGIVIIVLGSLLVIVLVAAFFIYRHIKLEAELAEMNWRVKWEDIMFGTMENDKKLRRQGSTLSLTRTNGEACAEGRVLIERSDTVDQSWCKCGQCEERDRNQRICCRQLELFGIFNEGTNCITTTEDFRNIVLNKEVLVAVFIHVMLVRRQRGAAPVDLSPCKFRLMATRQFLCWMHRGQKLKKESRMTIPSCVSRAIHLQFPDEVPEFSSTSRGSCTTSTLAELMPLEIQT